MAENSQDLGKNTGDDFREGKVTLPLVLAYRRGTDEEREFWKRAIVDGHNDEEAFNRAINLLQKHDAISDTVLRARHYVEMAKDALGPMQNSNHKQALIDVLEFCISRAT